MAKKTFNYDLEGLRGFAAVGVMVGHVFWLEKYFDTGFTPYILKTIVPCPHFDVLLFFMLSGFVIGVNHPTRMQAGDIRLYLNKRLTRLYPIYLFALLLALLVAKFNYGLPIIAANSVFAQNISAPAIWEFGPAWSLNFEVLFYLLFIPISFFGINPKNAFIVCLSAAVLSIYCPISPLVTGYFVGFAFWLLGVILSKRLEGEYRVKFLPALLYVMAIEKLLMKIDLSAFVGRIWPIPDKSAPGFQQMIGINDLFYLPYCFIVLLYFSKRAFKGRTLLFIVLSLCPLILVVSGLFKHDHEPTFKMGSIYFGLFLLTLVIPFAGLNNAVRRWAITIGGVSYALYLTHFSFECLMGHLTFLASPVANYWFKMAIYVPIVGLVSWFLEKKFQPFIKQVLTRQRTMPQIVFENSEKKLG